MPFDSFGLNLLAASPVSLSVLLQSPVAGLSEQPYHQYKKYPLEVSPAAKLWAGKITERCIMRYNEEPGSGIDGNSLMCSAASSLQAETDGAA